MLTSENTVKSHFRERESAQAVGHKDQPQMLARSCGGQINIDKLSVVFDRAAAATLVLEPTNAVIPRGQFVSLLGPSGCGKTTLLNSIGGIVVPTSGSVRIDDVGVTGPSAQCGMVFQQHSLFPWMTVLQNVAFGPKMLGHSSPEGVARTFLGLVGLEKVKNKYPSQLSGGMQQRVSIARALATYPPVLLMDEPFGALDAQTRSIMHAELIKIWNEFKITVVFVTHDVDEAILLSDRILVMKTAPGGVMRDIAVDVTRPRDADLANTPVLLGLKRTITGLIREESIRMFDGGRHGSK